MLGLRLSILMTPHTASISDVRFATNFERVLEEKGLHGALGLLNATTPYRLTGVYRFQDGLVRSVVLFDRKNPELVVGVDVPWKDSYCRLVAENGRRCEITDSLSDVRLGSHAAREAVQAYVAVLLKTPEGAALGTLCHYDLQPVEPPVDVFDALERVSPVVERHAAHAGAGTRSAACRARRPDAAAAVSQGPPSALMSSGAHLGVFLQPSAMASADCAVSNSQAGAKTLVLSDAL
jgi:hypothetical protein